VSPSVSCDLQTSTVDAPAAGLEPCALRNITRGTILGEGQEDSATQRPGTSRGQTRRRLFFHEHPKLRLPHDPGVDASEPLRPPAHFFGHPIEPGTGIRNLRITVTPGTHEPLAPEPTDGRASAAGNRGTSRSARRRHTPDTGWPSSRLQSNHAASTRRSADATARSRESGACDRAAPSTCLANGRRRSRIGEATITFLNSAPQSNMSRVSAPPT